MPRGGGRKEAPSFQFPQGYRTWTYRDFIADGCRLEVLGTPSAMSSGQRFCFLALAMTLGVFSNVAGYPGFGTVAAALIAAVILSGVGEFMVELIDQKDAWARARSFRLRVATEILLVVALMLFVADGTRPSPSALAVLSGAIAATILGMQPLEALRSIMRSAEPVETAPSTRAEAA